MLSERDYILITEYIDGELAGEQLRTFEQRLEQDEALRVEVNAQRMTMQILSLAEPVRLPRNFTLDPAVYGQTERVGFFDRLAAWFGPVPTAAASAAVMALLVFGATLFVGDTFIFIATPVAETSIETMVVEGEAGAVEEMDELSAEESMAADSAPADEMTEEEGDMGITAEDGADAEMAEAEDSDDSQAGDTGLPEGDALPPNERDIPPPPEQLDPPVDQTAQTQPAQTPLNPLIMIGAAAGLTVGVVTFVLVRQRMA